MAHQGIPQAERRVWRAVVFALAVLAQLVLPAIGMRAQALAAELCVLDNGDGSDTSKAHVHQQQCAHCRVHDCSALTPPAASEVAVVRVMAAATVAAARQTANSPNRRAQPPPTGPPAH